jgi:hypothetical protein
MPWERNSARTALYFVASKEVEEFERQLFQHGTGPGVITFVLFFCFFLEEREDCQIIKSVRNWQAAATGGWSAGWREDLQMSSM